MPAIIDHDARRAELARIAAELIAAQGLEAATVRAIAQAAGFSTKVVSHYFADKRALLLMTYRFAADETANTAQADRPAGADAQAHALSLLPMGRPAMVRNWKVWLAFWGFAISDAEFAEEQRRQTLRASGQLVQALSGDPRFSHLSLPQRERAAADLLTVVLGVAVQAAFDPGAWPPARQADAVLAQLAVLEDAERLAGLEASRAPYQPAG